MKQQNSNGGNQIPLREHAISVPKEQIEKAREEAIKKMQQQQQKNK